MASISSLAGSAIVDARFAGYSQQFNNSQLYYEFTSLTMLADRPSIGFSCTGAAVGDRVNKLAFGKFSAFAIGEISKKKFKDDINKLLEL